MPARLLSCLICLSAGLLMPAAAVAQLPGGTTWALVFADEFAGGTLDTMKWSPNYSWGRTHNHQAYMDPGQLDVSNGRLRIQAVQERHPDAPSHAVHDGKWYRLDYTSGAVNTANTFRFTNGYVEARMRLPGEIGAWAAFWTLGQGWPPEIDIMEYPIMDHNQSGNDKYRYWVNYHYGADWTQHRSYGREHWQGRDLSTGYNTYGVEWTESDRLHFYLNGSRVYSITDAAAVSQLQNQYLILNHAVGGWPGEPPSWPGGGSNFDIDWVRVWQPRLATAERRWLGTGASGSWTDAANWTTGFPKQGGHLARFTDVAGRPGVAVTWNDSQTLAGIVLEAPTTRYTLGNGTQSLMLADGPGGDGWVGIRVEPGGGTHTINSRLDLYGRFSVWNDGGVLTLARDMIEQSGGFAAVGEMSVGGTGTRRIPFFLLACDGLPAPDELLDATVRITAVVGSVRKTRGEFLAPQLVCSRRADVIVVEPPPSTPFEAPVVPLAELGRYRLESLSAHRIVAEGTVTFAAGKRIFIQDGARGVRVRAAAASSVSLGDRIRVAGFVEKGRRIAGIDGGLVETVGRGRPLEPIEITPDEVARINNRAIDRHMMAEPSDCDGCLITFPATLIETQRSDGGGDIVLSAGESTVAARLEGEGFGQLSELLPGSRVQITGVLQIHLLDDDGTLHVTSTPALRQMSLHLRTAGDVVVLSRPSWWTPQRLAILLGGVLAVLAGALVWVMMLRREVASQSRMLAHEMRRRRDAALEFAASTRERNRLAANLHDTLLQTLRGIDFQLGACRAYRHGPDADASEHLEVARRMVNHASEELRDSVWALRTMPLAGRSFGESLESVARQAGHGHAEHISVRIDGARFELPQFVVGNLLLVAQEAIHNALRHANASDIEVVASFDPGVGEVTVAVTDDGAGFTPGRHPGPDQGHFGIAGMRERIERLGGSLAVDSEPGGGTVVTARVRKRDYDARIDIDAEDVAAGVA